MKKIQPTKTKAAKPPAPAAAATATPKSTRVPRVKVSSAGASAPALSPRASTVITARIDVGFGNTVFIRGEGPGLSWEKGVPLSCTGGDLWSVSLTSADGPVTFKFLLNDERWSVGDNYVAAPGLEAAFSPAF